MLDRVLVMDALARATDAEGAAIVQADDVANVVVEGDTAIVVLAGDGPGSERLRRLHRQVVAELGGTVELRTAERVYRGGKGFGEGRHVVAVLGGKGGVGKSTVAINLAITLSAMGMSVGLLDGDVNGPDVPQMLGMKPAQRPRQTMSALFTTNVTPPSRRQRPVERFGMEAWSVGFVIPEGVAPAWTGRMIVAGLLRSLVFDVGWSADVLLIDAPPGTGEEIQALTRDLPLSGAVFVTTPQDLAQMDAERTLTLLRERDVPVIGMVQNMASLTCPHCGESIDMFAASPRLTDAGVSILGHIPFDVQLSVAAEQGYPLVLGNPRGPVAYEFARIGAAVRRWLSE
jgi:ATP-binding protein involved in chromosome partitioning